MPPGCWPATGSSTWPASGAADPLTDTVTRGSFLPSHHAFAFSNSWPTQPVVTLDTPFGDVEIGEARGGLCGGMVFAALDFWYAGAAPPPDRPTRRDGLYRFIVRRLIDSWHLPAGVAQYYQWMNLPDADISFDVLGRKVVVERGLAWRTLRVQWPQVKADLARGIPVPLGVVTVASRDPRDLGLNHQVLAYGYETAGHRATVRVYDPNRAGRDDVRIGFSTHNATRPVTFDHNLGLRRPVRGFFRTVFTPATPPGR